MKLEDIRTDLDFLIDLKKIKSERFSKQLQDRLDGPTEYKEFVVVHPDFTALDKFTREHADMVEQLLYGEAKINGVVLTSN